MFPVGREKTRMVKQVQKVKDRKMKNEKEEICSPSTLHLWGWGAFSMPKLICSVFKLLLSKLGE